MRRVRRITLVCCGFLLLGLASAGAAFAEPTRVLSWGVDPVPVAGLSEVTAIGAGYEHELAVVPGGSVYGWGSNLGDELGRPSKELTGTETPVLIEGVGGAVAVTGGDAFSLALLEDGTVMAWGSNQNGALGTGSKEFLSPTPTKVAGLEHVRAIAANGKHALALLEDGTVMAWGGGGGTGTTDESNVPVPVAGLTGVTAIAAGQQFSLALLEDGTVESWGWGYSGELGNGSFEFVENETPTPIGGLEHVKAISAGGETAMALLEDGTVKGWGDGGSGSLAGGETFADHATPIPIAGLSGVTEIATGLEANIAVLEDGTVKALGHSVKGNDTFAYGTGPTTVCGAQGATLLAVNGGSHVQGREGTAFAVTPVNPLCVSLSELVYGYGSPGETVTIRGSNLNEATSVRFGSTPVEFTINSSHSITATVPPGSGVTNVTLASSANETEASQGNQFVFTQPPTFGKCSRAEGVVIERFGDFNCTSAIEPGGFSTRYGWTPVFSGSFETAAAKGLKLETGKKLKLTCHGETGTGEFTGVRSLDNVVLTLTGCEGPGGKCNSAGQGEGVVRTNPLEGVLGVVTEAAEPVNDKLGLELAGHAPSRIVAELSCGTSSLVLRGGAIAQVTANVMAGKGGDPTKGKNPTISFVQKKGVQNPESFAGSPAGSLESSLNGGAFEAIGVKGKMTGPRIEFSSVV